MFNHNARSNAGQNLAKLFNRELADRRNFYLTLIAIALFTGICIGSIFIHILTKLTDGFHNDHINAADASLLAAIEPIEYNQVAPTDRETLISKVWSCQLNWVNKVESPETLTKDQLDQLLQDCKNARSGGDR
jgi:hypothetical protein